MAMWMGSPELNLCEGSRAAAPPPPQSDFQSRWQSSLVLREGADAFSGQRAFFSPHPREPSRVFSGLWPASLLGICTASAACGSLAEFQPQIGIFGWG